MAMTVEKWISVYGNDFGYLPSRATDATEARPGSKEKIDAMQNRVADGLQIHASGDIALEDSCGRYARAELGDGRWVGKVNKGYEQSLDGRYIYRVRRVWNPDKPIACVIGRNPPMTSNGLLRNIKEQVSSWGCGGFELVHLFALRHDDPNQLGHHDDPIGTVNDRAIRLAIHGSTYVVCAWGRWGAIMGRAANVMWAISQSVSKTRMYCLGLTRTVPSALDEGKRFCQPVDFTRAFRPWIPRLLPMGLLEQERILRS